MLVGRPPVLLTFDVFGTLVDWRRGVDADDDEFDRIIDWQGADESRAFRPYREIVADSLIAVLGMGRTRADRIGAEIGRWPLFPDSREALRRLMRIAPCMAMTNSDHLHGEQVQEQLGFRLSDWLCAEEARIYKPSERFWHVVSERRGIPFGPAWWHVSAYADYDLDVAGRLGLTTVFVARPHSRPGRADLRCTDLLELAIMAAT